jgi:hypothetical protein
MGRSRVVIPEVVRVPLSEGDYIDVKRDLNAGEYFDLLTVMAERRKFAKILAYLVGWSFVGQDEHPIPYALDDPEDARRDTIGALDKGTLRELVAAIDKHEAAQDQALAKKKATLPVTDGALVSAAT